MELCIQRNLLHKWAEMLKRHGCNTETIFRGPVSNKLGKHHDPLKTEVARLKRELALVTRERDMLKKAKAYFAKVRK